MSHDSGSRIPEIVEKFHGRLLTDWPYYPLRGLLPDSRFEIVEAWMVRRDWNERASFSLA